MRERCIYEGKEKAPIAGGLEFGALGEIRTPYPLVRSQVLYPDELRARFVSRALYGTAPELQAWPPKQPAVMTTANVRMPKYPECWESCGNCANGNVFILEVLVHPGEHLERDDNILTLETGKVSLDIPTPWAGTVVAVHVEAGDSVDEGALLITLERD